MRFFIAALLLLPSIFCIAQEDEFPDIRSKRDLFVRVQDKNIRADLASFTMAGIDESAGKLSLRSLSLTGVGKDFIAFEGYGIAVRIKAGRFDPSKHKLQYYTNPDNNKKYLTRIDFKPFFGDYGKVPEMQIDSVTVILGTDTVAIPKEAYFDLYNPIFSYNEGGTQKHINNVYLSADGRKIYIYMLKREIGGSYEVTWVIQDKKYLRRVVDFGFLKE